MEAISLSKPYEIRFTVPGKPVQWKSPESTPVRFSKFGRTHRPAYHEYLGRVAAYATEQKLIHRQAIDRCYCNGVHLSVTFFLLRAKSNKTDRHIQAPDLEQLVTPISDGIKKYLFCDDCQIDKFREIEKKWCLSADEERAEVTVYLFEA